MDKFTSNGESLWIALDIGGTLTKIVCMIPKDFEERFQHLEDIVTPRLPLESLLEALHDSRNLPVTNDTTDLVAKTYLFSSRELPTLVETLRSILGSFSRDKTIRIRVTGGGALKYAQVLKTELGVEVDKIEEMSSLVIGLGFVLKLQTSAFRYDLKSRRIASVTNTTPVYPLLLVSIGSGVSIMRVDSPNVYKRVSGTALGGGTALGLGKLLLGCESFQDLIDLSMRGDSSRVDLTVGDLMGVKSQTDTGSLAPDILAASLGKAGLQPRREDLAQSIIRMVSYNLGYIACLVARLQNIRTLYFSGKFVHRHEPTMQAIAYAVDFYRRTWEAEARFLLHEGYLGAIGALLSSND